MPRLGIDHRSKRDLPCTTEGGGTIFPQLANFATWPVYFRNVLRTRVRARPLPRPSLLQIQPCRICPDDRAPKRLHGWWDGEFPSVTCDHLVHGAHSALLS